MSYSTTSNASSSSSADKCSICMEDVSDRCGRTVVKLRCSHLFHLDCIGSAFNVKGVMECPNCREIENGVWRCFENGSPDLAELIGVEETDPEAPVEFLDLGTQGTFLHRRHADNEWEFGFIAPSYRDFVDLDARGNFAGIPYTNHQLNGPPSATLSAGAFISQIDWTFDRFICGTCINLFPRGEHTGGAHLVPAPSANPSARADLNGMPNEPFGPQVLEQGICVEGTLESPFGLGYQGSRDPVYPNSRRMQQPPTISPSPVTRSSLRRPNGSRGSFPAEHTDAFSWSLNFNANLSESATPSYRPVRERNEVQPLQLFPEEAGSFLPDMNH